MSKRFGRNQKRKMRDELAQAQRESRGYLRNLRNAQEEGRAAVVALRAVIDVNPHHPALVEAADITEINRRANQYSPPVKYVGPFDVAIDTRPVDIRTINLHDFEIQLRSDPAFTDAVIFKCRMGNEAVCYKASRQALQIMSRGALQQYISEMLATEIKRHPDMFGEMR